MWMGGGGLFSVDPIQTWNHYCFEKMRSVCNLPVTFKQYDCTAAVSLNPWPSPPHNLNICTDLYSLSAPLLGSRSISSQPPAPHT